MWVPCEVVGKHVQSFTHADDSVNALIVALVLCSVIQLEQRDTVVNHLNQTFCWVVMVLQIPQKMKGSKTEAVSCCEKQLA